MTAHLTNWIAGHGVVAVFVLMAVDAVLPAGGELVMLFAGALAAGAIAGHTGPSLAEAVLAGTLGYLAGSMAGWGVGRIGGRAFVERRGRWLHIGPERFARAERWFDRFGSLAVFLGRLTPLVRSFISIPAGALGSPFRRYTLLTLAASAIWCLAFAAAGWALGGKWDDVHRAFRYVDYVAVVAVIAALAIVIVRVRRRPATS
jgi:membrane protein DedA with SNARE-associated domain